MLNSNFDLALQYDFNVQVKTKFWLYFCNISPNQTYLHHFKAIDIQLRVKNLPVDLPSLWRNLHFRRLHDIAESERFLN